MSYVHKGPILRDKSIGATLEGKPIIIRDINKTNRLQYPEDAKQEGIGAIVSIPIKFYDSVIGALRLYHHEVWDISEKDVDSLSVLARNIGLAMAYTRMLKTVKKIKYAIDDIESLR
jgi:transcriptional regulator with GAF, ATPase, and Fis domain